jgi:hypothetical protein
VQAAPASHAKRDSRANKCVTCSSPGAGAPARLPLLRRSSRTAEVAPDSRFPRLAGTAAGSTAAPVCAGSASDRFGPWRARPGGIQLAMLAQQGAPAAWSAGGCALVLVAERVAPLRVRPEHSKTQHSKTHHSRSRVRAPVPDEACVTLGTDDGHPAVDESTVPRQPLRRSSGHGGSALS